MHYELAPWLPALCSHVPAPTGCCDTSHAVNMLEPAGVSPSICGVRVWTLSLPRHGGLFSKPLGSLLHIDGTHLCSPQPCCGPWHWICYILLLPTRAGRVLMSRSPSPKAPQDAPLQGWQRISEVYLLPSLCSAGVQKAPELEPEGGGVTPAVLGHSDSIHVMHPLFATLLYA